MLPTHPVSRQVAHVAGSLHGASHRWWWQRWMQLAQAQPASVGRSLLAPPHTQQPAAAASSESAGGALFATPVLSEYDSPAGAQPAHQRHSRTPSGENDACVSQAGRSEQPAQRCCGMAPAPQQGAARALHATYVCAAA